MATSGGTLDPSTGLTCLSCRLVFADSNIQRDHYQTDWHRYNLKRRVAGLPAVTREAFDELAQKYSAAAELEAANKKAENDGGKHCAACRKTFQSAATFEQHLRSKRHSQMAAEKLLDAESENNGEKQKNEEKTVENEKKAKEQKEKEKGGELPLSSDEKMELERGKEEVTEEEEDDGEEGGDWVTVNGDEEEMDYDESQAISLRACLFCARFSGGGGGEGNKDGGDGGDRFLFPSFEAAMEHMEREHGFRPPDFPFCSDLPGLLRYLGEKVGCGRVCLRCGQRNFRDVAACQKHMRDKNHCGFSLDERRKRGTPRGKRAVAESESSAAGESGDQLLEYIDFYDYSPLYEDDQDGGHGDDQEEDVFLFDEGAFLVLPSGARIGHRSLQRYFRQSLRPPREGDECFSSGEKGKHQMLHGKILLALGPGYQGGKGGGQMIASKFGGKVGVSGLARGIHGNYALSNAEVQRRARDVAFAKRKLQQLRLRQGLAGNRLFKSRGRDDQQ